MKKAVSTTDGFLLYVLATHTPEELLRLEICVKNTRSNDH
tara:strand:+ start:474 stop:593 length:120 start_codon:yes stop_codon:yes gene_type:complete